MNDVDVIDLKKLLEGLTDDLHGLAKGLNELWKEANRKWEETYDSYYEGMMTAYDYALQLVEGLFGVKVEEESGGMNNGMD